MPLRVVTGRVEDTRTPNVPGPSGLLGPAWLVGPSAPATVVAPSAGLRLAGTAGARAESRLVVENHQAAASLVRPMLSPLTGPGSSRWNPVGGVDPPHLVLMPGGVLEATLWIDVPPETPAGTYTGTLAVLGARGAVPVTVDVARDDG